MDNDIGMLQEENFIDYVNKLQSNKSLDLPHTNEGPWKVLDNIYLGCQDNALNVGQLQEIGINSLLNCAAVDSTPPIYATPPGIINYQAIVAEDMLHYPIHQHFQEALKFLQRCQNNGSKVLIYCRQGVNRSCTICAVYLMTYCQFSLLEAVSYLFTVKNNIFTNSGFLRCLYRYCKDNCLPLITSTH